MRFSLMVGVVAVVGCTLYAQTAKPPETTKNAIGMEFVKIPPGEFLMGCSAGDAKCGEDEKPQHKVRITKGFEMGKYEVTQAQYKAVVGAEALQAAIPGDNLPVENVTKAEAIRFMDALTAKNDGFKYRLPTEAEWEYAARAGNAAALYGPLDEIAWHQGNSDDTTHPVGQKKPNAWGLYDVLGNVREWTNDIWLATYYANSPVDDPPGAPQNSGMSGQPGFQGGAGSALPLIRGGGWDNPAEANRLSSRYHYFGITLRRSNLGIRALREPVTK